MYRAVVSLGLGSCAEGFQSVSVTLIDSDGKPQLKRIGRLPANPELALLYQRWKRLYRAYYIQLSPDAYRLEFLPDEEDPYHFSESEFQVCCDRLRINLNEWLASPSFANITNLLRGRLHHQQCFQWIIESEDPVIQHLPWHLWSFFQDYPLAEVAMSLPEFEQIVPSQNETGDDLKILVILGKTVNHLGDEINVQADRRIIESMPQVSAVFIHRTSQGELSDLLWEQDWDIILFAGHSSRPDLEGQAGFLLETDTTQSLITIQDLENAFRDAIKRGLKLVIFNSCDSFELGLDLMRLNLPQCIAMGEAIPDAVAQRFLRYLIQQWYKHDSFVIAVRNARTRLKESEDSSFPCASWLPVICQNPAALPPTWPVRFAELETVPLPDQGRQFRSIRSRSWFHPLATGVGLLGILCGIRLGGGLESLELQAFDTFHQLSPSEREDKKILLITVSEEDIQYQDQQKMQRKGSLSDVALGQLLEKLTPLGPRAIAVDIFHDFEYEPPVQQIIRNTPNFIAVCEVGHSYETDSSIAPPPSLSIEQVGFADLVVDRDDVIRRQLLRMQASFRCPTDYGLGLKLAQAYLGLTVEGPNERGELTLGTQRLPRLTPQAGGYHLPEVEASGYQIMTRYRREQFKSISLRSVLTATESNLQELAQDRLVIIGLKLRKRDALHTPTKFNIQNKLTGMEIHAHMASQLIHAVEQERALIWWWPEWLEYLWISLWIMIGVMISYFVRNPLVSFGLLAGTTAILTLVCYRVFLMGGWIPFIPVILGISLFLIRTGIHLWFKQGSVRASRLKR